MDKSLDGFEQEHSERQIAGFLRLELLEEALELFVPHARRVELAQNLLVFVEKRAIVLARQIE